MRAALRPYGHTLLKETFAIVYWVLIIWTTKQLAARNLGVLEEYERKRPLWCAVAVAGFCSIWYWAEDSRRLARCTLADDAACTKDEDWWYEVSFTSDSSGELLDRVVRLGGQHRPHRLPRPRAARLNLSS